MCLCLSVISEISGTGGRSAMLLTCTPSQRASPAKLCQLLLELTGHLVWELKPLELFRSKRVKPCPSCYNCAVLKKLVVFWKRVELFHLHLGRSKAEERPRSLGSFTKAWRKLSCSRKNCEVWGTGCGWLTAVRLVIVIAFHLSTYFKLTVEVGALWPLAGMQQARRKSWLSRNLFSSRVEAVTLVNRLWLAYSRPSCKGHHRSLHKGHLLPQLIGTVLMLRTAQFVNGLLGH